MTTFKQFRADKVELDENNGYMDIYVDKPNDLSQGTLFDDGVIQVPYEGMDPEFRKKFPLTNIEHRQIGIAARETDGELLAVFYKDRLVWPVEKLESKLFLSI